MDNLLAIQVVKYDESLSSNCFLGCESVVANETCLSHSLSVCEALFGEVTVLLLPAM